MTPARGVVLAIVAGFAGCGRHVRVWPNDMRTQAPQQVAEGVAAERGHPVLFTLYASWCKTCRDELPVLDRIYTRYNGRALSVVAISLDDDPEDFAAMMPVVPRWFPLVRVTPVDEASVAASVSVLGGSWSGPIPYIAVFDRSGALLREWPAGRATEAQLDAAVNEAL